MREGEVGEVREGEVREDEIRMIPGDSRGSTGGMVKSEE